MRSSRNKKKQVILFISVFLIGFGAWFVTSNVYQFAKGYFAVKHMPHPEEPVNKVEASEKEKPTEKELYPVRPKIGEEIGELYIPKLDATLPIFHGTDENELEKGVGHFADSVLPGEKDNSVLSGHRDTVFRKLGEVGVGDWLIVRTSAGEFKYKVSKVRIVDDDDRTVIVPKPKATLTVTTCYPFNFIGSAPERYVLVAYLDSKTLSTKA